MRFEEGRGSDTGARNAQSIFVRRDVNARNISKVYLMKRYRGEGTVYIVEVG